MNSQMELPETKTLEVRVSRDRMKAFLMIHPGAKIEYEEIIRELESAGITHGIKSPERLRDFLDNPELFDYCFIVAAGRPFAKGPDAGIVYHFENVPLSDAAGDELFDCRRDFSKIGCYSFVKKGSVVAEKIPAGRGADGYTVFGETFKGEWGIETSLRAGAYVAETAEGCFTAQIDGIPSVRDNVLVVDPAYIVEGDYDGSAGNTKFAGTIVIKGNVLGNPHIAAAGDVIVEGSVEGADIAAGGDIIVKKKINNSGYGMLKAGGYVFSRSIEASIIKAGKGVVAEERILHSRVSTDGKVEVTTGGGCIEGGFIVAGGGVSADRIGNSNRLNTIIQAGYPPDVRLRFTREIGEIKALRKELADAQVQFRRYSYSDSAENKGKAILERIAALIHSIKSKQIELQKAKRESSCNSLAKVKASNGIYPGAFISLGDDMIPIDRFYYGADISICPKTGRTIPLYFDIDGKPIKNISDRNKSVLIVDDCKDIRRFLSLVIKRMGFTVVGEAQDGETGVELFKKHRPAFVTCDINMVNMNGIDTLRAMKAADPDVKVIMISALKNKESVMKCIAAGASDYLTKPVTPGAVESVLKTALSTVIRCAGN